MEIEFAIIDFMKAADRAGTEKRFLVSSMPHHGKVNFERDVKWSVLRPTVCDSLRVSRADN